jgi:hypothetical protein
VLAVTAGGLLWGVAGAFLVPLVSVVARGASYLSSRSAIVEVDSLAGAGSVVRRYRP